MNDHPEFPFIEAIIADIKSVINYCPVPADDNAPPSDDILESRLRGKMYGAQVVTYRHFLRMVLNKPSEPNNEISKPIMMYAERCIRALFNSSKAFWGMKGGRLIVTNVWGTCHAYV